ncbi:MAG: hypothetical protein HZB98_01125, partial [Bacteroidia bacterium]|nr:hypothetical protein [Bacteroidia bacterium]
MNKAIYTIILLVLTIGALNGQDYIQVSGIISDEANRLVSGAAIISKKLKKGTVSEGYGIYSITSTPGDTIL